MIRTIAVTLLLTTALFFAQVNLNHDSESKRGKLQPSSATFQMQSNLIVISK